jgi:hypothetical protein
MLFRLLIGDISADLRETVRLSKGELNAKALNNLLLASDARVRASRVDPEFKR